MNANELLKTSEITWLIEKSEEMISFDGGTIPGSAHFTGTLPCRMAQKIRKLFKEAGATMSEGRSVSIYSVSSGDTEDDFSINVKFGSYKSTQNRVTFNLCPYTW